MAISEIYQRGLRQEHRCIQLLTSLNLFFKVMLLHAEEEGSL
jgi:hypothetical protein